jgi:hypothetical protein
MKPQSHSVQPPRIARWLISLFTPAEQAETIEGDLLEEFSHLTSASGVGVARRWYWRQTAKTIPHLATSGFRAAPLSTAAAVVGGCLLGRFVYGVPDKALMALTERYLSYWQSHFNAYVFLATDGMMMAQVILLTIVGCVVALAAKGREMIATMALGVIVGALGAVALFWLMATGQVPLDGWMLALRFADPFAIVTGGVIVRMCRLDSKLQTE